MHRFESDRHLKYLQMYYTYVLRSKKDNKLYIGQTSDLLRRIIDHNLGLVKSTKHRIPFVKVYYETYETRLHYTSPSLLLPLHLSLAITHTRTFSLLSISLYLNHSLFLL